MDYELKARSFILAYCRVDQVPENLEYLIPVMVQEDKNKAGAEGLTSRSVSGINENYINGYSEGVMSVLKKHRRIIVL